MNILGTGMYVAQLVDSYAENNPDSTVGRIFGKAEEVLGNVKDDLSDQLSHNSTGGESKFMAFIGTAKAKLSELGNKIQDKIESAFGIDLGRDISEDEAEREPTADAAPVEEGYEDGGEKAVDENVYEPSV